MQDSLFSLLHYSCLYIKYRNSYLLRQLHIKKRLHEKGLIILTIYILRTSSEYLKLKSPNYLTHWFSVQKLGVPINLKWCIMNWNQLPQKLSQNKLDAPVCTFINPIPVCHAVMGYTVMSAERLVVRHKHKQNLHKMTFIYNNKYIIV